MLSYTQFVAMEVVACVAHLVVAILTGTYVLEGVCLQCAIEGDIQFSHPAACTASWEWNFTNMHSSCAHHNGGKCLVMPAHHTFVHSQGILFSDTSSYSLRICMSNYIYLTATLSIHSLASKLSIASYYGKDAVAVTSQAMSSRIQLVKT